MQTLHRFHPDRQTDIKKERQGKTAIRDFWFRFTPENKQNSKPKTPIDWFDRSSKCYCAIELRYWRPLTNTKKKIDDDDDGRSRKKMATGGQFCLRWNNHQPNMVSVFTSLLQNDQLVDVTLLAENNEIHAHKMVLAACSPYFQVSDDAQYMHCTTLYTQTLTHTRMHLHTQPNIRTQSY